MMEVFDMKNSLEKVSVLGMFTFIISPFGSKVTLL